MGEFFGFGGYQRQPEGYFSWQHLLFASSMMVIMIIGAIFLGRWARHKDEKTKNRVLLITAIALDAFELFRIILLCFRNENALDWLHNLPLFLCSMQFIAIPLAALAKGRLKEAALDFVFVFGILGAIMGNYFAGQNFSVYPVLSFDNVASGITHTTSGFASLYIVIAGMASMKWKNMPWCFVIMTVFCGLAYIANVTIPYNYMFLMRGDGTPYDLIYAMVGGNPVAYPLMVLLLFFAYISVFYSVFHLVLNLVHRRKEAVA